MNYNSTIKIKTGECIDCKDGIDKPIIAGRCRAYHYPLHLKLEVLRRKQESLVRFENGKTALQLWYGKIMKEEEAKCWNCGAEAVWLKQPKNQKKWHACIAHILPKAIFGSVATNEFNYMILFDDLTFVCNCHDKYDDIYNSNLFASIQMPVMKIARYRFNLFKDKIAPDEVRRIPSIFLMNENVFK